MNIWSFVVPAICLLGFTAHTAINIVLDLSSGKTSAESSARNLSSMELPFVFQVSVSPAFNSTAMFASPYGQPFYYFKGTDNGTGRLVGWETKNSSDNGQVVKNVSGRLESI